MPPQYSALLTDLDKVASTDENGKQLPYSAVSFVSSSGTKIVDGGPRPLLGGVTLRTKTNVAADSGSVPSDGKDMATLMKMLSAASGGPGDSVAADSPPLPVNVGIIPPGSDEDIATKYNYLTQLSALSSLYTTIWYINTLKQRGRDTPYSISNPAEAAQAFADLADSGYQAMTGPLAGFYNYSNAVVSTFEKSMRKTEVHLEFLSELFKPYNLASDAIKSLDGILTSFVGSLANISIQSSGEKSTVNQTLRINQISQVNVTGDNDNPKWLYIPKTRIVYMKIDNETWKRSTSKHGSDEGFNFKMQTTVVDCELNVEKYLARKDKLDAIFNYVTDMNLQAFGEKTNAPPVQSQS